MTDFFQKSIYVVAILFFFNSCEFIARELFAGDHCLVCEVRVSENRWVEEPVWREKGCGGKLARLEELCEEEAKKRGGVCECIFYTE